MRINRALILILLLLALSAGCSKGNNSSESGEVTLVISTIGKTTSENLTISNSTALQILEHSHAVESVAYPAIGKFVKCIDRVCSDSSYFWAFYINGNLSSIAASSYIPRKGDILEFKYEKIAGYR